MTQLARARCGYCGDTLGCAKPIPEFHIVYETAGRVGLTEMAQCPTCKRNFYW